MPTLRVLVAFLDARAPTPDRIARLQAIASQLPPTRTDAG
jgi:hypothetical protein